MTANQITSDDRSSRRLLIAAGVAGAVAAVAGSRSASASAPPSTEPPDVTEPPPTAASVPSQPTEADVEILRFLQSAELAAADLYREAVAAGADDPVFAQFATNHRAYADVLAGLLGGPQPPLLALFEEHQAAFGTSDVTAVAEAAHGLESAMVATNIESLGELEGTHGATRVAAALVVESRMCAVLADLAALLVNDADPLSPTEA